MRMASEFVSGILNNEYCRSYQKDEILRSHGLDLCTLLDSENRSKVGAVEPLTDRNLNNQSCLEGNVTR